MGEKKVTKTGVLGSPLVPPWFPLGSPLVPPWFPLRSPFVPPKPKVGGIQQQSFEQRLRGVREHRPPDCCGRAAGLSDSEPPRLVLEGFCKLATSFFYFLHSVPFFLGGGGGGVEVGFGKVATNACVKLCLGFVLLFLFFFRGGGGWKLQYGFVCWGQCAVLQGRTRSSCTAPILSRVPV